MSIVAVHGPTTFGSMGVQESGPVQASGDPTNGLIWTFTLDDDTTRVAADFDWTFTGGTPATQADSKGPVTVTYATPGAKTASLLVSGAGTGGNPYPAAGTYPITVTAVSGAAPQLRMAPGGGEEGEEQVEEGLFDPGEHTVADVLAYAESHPDEVGDIYDAEIAGKNRSTLVSQLDALIPYDPGDYTVDEVLGYANANPGEVDDIIDAERAGKNRSTLLSQLEALT